jgi:hypothetical protein
MTTNYERPDGASFRGRGPGLHLLWYQAGGPKRGRFLHKRPDDDPVVLPEQPNDYGYPFFADRPVILKLHGTARDETGDGSYVITEDHYIEYLSRVDHRAVPKTLVQRWINLLYLGYSLRDYNLRVIVRRLQQADGRGRASWTVLREACLDDVDYWARHEVKVIQADLSDFIPRLQSALAGASARAEAAHA